MKTKLQIAILAFAIGFGGDSHAETVRATEMTSAHWSQIGARDGSELIIEFRQGDVLPVNFTFQGDLLETSHAGISYVTVKRNFFLMLSGKNIQISLDGTVYKRISEVISGRFTAGARSSSNGGPADVIDLVLSADLK